METFYDFFYFLPDQCCDAVNYLYYGRVCAETGNCYNELRPLGAVYWFSIPYRLGLNPAAALTSANLLLAIVSIVLSIAAMKNLLREYFSSGSQQAMTALILASVTIHLVFLYPVLRFSLSDTPASLLMLISLWLLLMLPGSRAPGFFLCALVGISLGLAAWIRVFFLYPVLLVVFLGLLILWPKQKKAAVGLLLALLPISLQVTSTWNHTGAYSYLAPAISAEAAAVHLDDRRVGYDTLLPTHPYNWYSPCVSYAPLSEALRNRDLHSLGCLLSGRLNFYLGSYSALSYPYDDARYLDSAVRGCDINNIHPCWSENLLSAYPRDMENSGAFHQQNLRRIENAGPGADGTPTAHLLLPTDAQAYGEISQTVLLQRRAVAYEFSVWLWSASEPRPVTMAIRHHDGRNIIAQKEFVLPAAMEVRTLGDIKITETGYYDVLLGLPGMQDGAADSGVFVWGEFDLRQFVPPQQIIFAELPNNFRLWSDWILWANSAACLGAVFFLFSIRKKLSALQWLGPALIVLSCGMALVIIPEQRFVIAPMIALWFFSIAGLLLLLLLLLTRRAKVQL